MQTIDLLLEDQHFFAGLGPPALRVLSGCARNTHFAPGQYLFRETEPAGTFYVIRTGRVAVEVHDPRGGAVVVDTVEDGGVVGWSWLVPPYQWLFDARAVSHTSAIGFDAMCLRGRCDADPALGYALLQRVTEVMSERLQAARVRLLDLYGAPR